MMTLSKVGIDTIDFKGLFVPPLPKGCHATFWGLNKYKLTKILSLMPVGCSNSSVVCCYLKFIHLK